MVHLSALLLTASTREICKKPEVQKIQKKCKIIGNLDLASLGNWQLPSESQVPVCQATCHLVTWHIGLGDPRGPTSQSESCARLIQGRGHFNASGK